MRNENTSDNETINVAELGCDLVTVRPNNTDLVGEDYEEDLLLNQKIIVDFRSYPTLPGDETRLNPGQAINGNRISCDKYGIPVRSVSLNCLLKQLIRFEAFSESDGPIEVPGHGDFTIADLFVNSLEANHRRFNNYHGYWGMISNVDESGGALWFNFGCGNGVSACLDQRFYNELYERHGTDNLNTFAGSYMLVFGIVTLSGQGKRCIFIDDPSYYALRLAQ